MSAQTANHLQHSQGNIPSKMENGGTNISGDEDQVPLAQRKKHKKASASEGSEKKKIKLDGKHKESSNHVHKKKEQTPIKAVIKKSSLSPEKKIKSEKYGDDDDDDNIPLGDKMKVKTDSYKIKTNNSDGITLKLKKEKPDGAVKKEGSKNNKKEHHHHHHHHHDKKKKEKDGKVKKEKVKKEIDSDDEKPLSARVEKSKTPSKTPVATANSVHKKRKKSLGADDESDDDEYQPLAKVQKKSTVKKEKEKEKVKEKEKLKEKVKVKEETAKKDKKKQAASPAAKKKKPVKEEKEEKEVKDEKKKKKKEEEQETWKWWEETPHPEGVKWVSLSHKGPYFPPVYERLPSSVKFYYDGTHVKLSDISEEVAGFYAKMLDHEYTTKKVFNDNFFGDWRKQMTPEERNLIKDLKKCNFKEMFEYFTLKNEERKAMTKEQKQVIKKQNEEITNEYGFCLMDKHKQKVGNFKIEPPGLFRGRGDHPKQGKLKLRVQPEDITINIGADAEVPKPPEGHKWKNVINDNKVTWLACWIENIQGSYKYVMLNPTSRLKGEKDWQKYETARKLKDYVQHIRTEYQQDWKSREMRLRQRGVALYFIDKLALRAGHEKDDDTADTVGCCSLRVEHIKLHEEYDDKEFVVEFDFLGKDSIRYVNHVPVEKRVFKNLQIFTEGKQPNDDLFDRLTTQMLNKYLNEKMEGLTAKVFRTYNASMTLQDQLNKLTQEEDSVVEKVLTYNRANRAVAILCNHQRAAPKSFEQSMSNLQNKISDKKKQIKETKKELKELKAKAKESKSDKTVSAAEKKKVQVQRLEEQLLKLEISATDKEENKEIALGTSKLNYLDPRISIGWCKKNTVPVEKIYNKTQREKFAWAIDMTEVDFEF